jgi:TonB-dependent receptor
MGDVDFTASRSTGFTTKLLTGASVFALTCLAATPALAQDAPAQQPAESPPPTGQPNQKEEATDGESIVVTGIRASLRSARNIKKNSDQIVDSITAQDIGALPDRSVSEALQRIPGVTLQRTNAARDPARLSAEGGAVFVRGLSWVRSEFNGRDTFSANSGRALGFEDVPADLLAGVDIYKNPTADLIEGGIGGLVNLRTRKPFDQAGQLIAFSADVNYADLRKKKFYSGNALYSNRWHTGIGDLGILLAGSINNIGNRTDEVQTGAYVPQTVGADTFYFPNSLGFRRIDWTQRRTAFDGSIQWSPADNFTLTLEGIYSKAKSHDIENVVGISGTLPAPGTAGVDYTFDDDNNVLTAHIPASSSGGYPGLLDLLDARYGRRTDVTKDFSANARWEPTSNITVTADVQRVESSMHNLSMTAFDQFALPVDIDFDFTGKNPWIHYTAPGDSQLQQSNYWWAAAMDHFDDNNADQWAYKADLEYRFEGDSFLKSFKFGARATDRNAISRATTWNWQLLSRQHWMGLPPAPNTVYLDDEGNPANPGLPDQSQLDPFNNFFRGDIPDVGSWWVPSDSLVSHGTAHAYEFLKSTLSNGWGWTPIPEGGYLTINDQKEKTLGGYGVLRFGMDGPLHFDGNLGVRVVRTRNDAGDLQVTAPTVLNIPSLATCQQAAADRGISASICDPLAQIYAFAGGTTVPTLGNVVPTKNNYTDVMPTLNLRFFLQDNMFLRFAAGRAISRPSFSQLQPIINLGINFDALTGFPSQCNITPPTFVCNSPFTGTASNPALKPIKSDQFDVSWEYYFGNAGQLSAALFYKRVKDFIFAGNSVLSVTNNAETLDFQMTQLQNGDKGSIKGFELAYQQFFDFLPKGLDGLGLGANLTYVKSKGGRNTTDAPADPNQVAGSTDATLPLEGLSKWSYNIFAMYEKYGISARLAYNWRSSYLLTTSAANINRPVWSRSYGQLDGSIFYNLTKNFKAGIQGTNLLSSKTYLEVGGADRHPFYSSNVTDRRIAFVIRGQF